MVVLTGTTSEEHMIDDLGILDISLTADEMDLIDGIGGDPKKH